MNGAELSPKLRPTAKCGGTTGETCPPPQGHSSSRTRVQGVGPCWGRPFLLVVLPVRVVLCRRVVRRLVPF